jgi:hypothetical protein
MDTTWAIVEVLGHHVIAGQVSEETVVGLPLLRVDVPAVGDEPAFTKFFSGAAIYALTPTDEKTARAAAAQLRSKPVQPYVLPERQLPAPREPVIPSWEEVRDEECEEEAELDPPERI